MIESCSVCEAELASVTLTTEHGSARVGKKCAALLERLAALVGAKDVRRRPALQLVE